MPKVIPKKIFFALGLLIFAQVLINFIWLKIDSFPLIYDNGGYFKRSIEMFYAGHAGLVEFIKEILGKGKHIVDYNPHRIIMQLFSLPWYYLFGPDPDIAVMSLTTFLVVSILSVYAIAARIFGRMAGFLAAFILSTSPGFFTLYRSYIVESVSIALICLTAYLFLCGDNFKNKQYSLLFGVFTALSMLTKELAFAFIAPLIIFALWKIEKKALFNLGLALLIAAAIVCPIYWMHKGYIYNQLFSIMYSAKAAKAYGYKDHYSIGELSVHPQALYAFSFLPLYCLLFSVGAVYCLVDKIKNARFLLFWAIVSYIIADTVQVRVTRHMLPILLPMAAIAGYAVDRMFRAGIKRKIFIALVLIWGAAQVFLTSFPAIRLSERIYQYGLLTPQDPKPFYPVKEDWKLEEITKYLSDNSKKSASRTYAYVGANLAAFSRMTLGYAAARQEANLVFAGYTLPFEEIFCWDFIIIKSGKDQGYWYTYEEMRKLKNALAQRKDFVKLPRKFPLPDGSEAEIYKKI